MRSQVVRRWEAAFDRPNKLPISSHQEQAGFSCETTDCDLHNICRDIEKNPGPNSLHVDPSKTIKAPYSQGNITVFGQNAGKQCVAMSLCSLI